MAFIDSEKKQLDEFFLEARRNKNIPSAEKLLRAGLRSEPKNHGRKIAVIATLICACTGYFAFEKSSSPEKILPEKISRKEISSRENFAENPVAGKNFSSESEKKNYVDKRPEKIPPMRPVRKFSLSDEHNISASNEGTEYDIYQAENSPDINLVELTPDELKKLGIEISPDGFTWTHAPFGDQRHIIVNFSESDPKPKPELRTVDWFDHFKNSPPDFIPVRVTDLSGAKEFFAHDESEKFASEENSQEYFEHVEAWCRIVEHRENSEQKKNFLPVKAGNFIVWFAPDNDVISALPEHVCGTIRAELGENLSSEPSRGFCYLDICEKASGAIICAKISPNPVTDRKTVMSYELNDNRKITAEIYDLSGKKLNEYFSSIASAKGRYDVEISLEGMEKGIFLVVISTEKGERISRRVVVN